MACWPWPWWRRPAASARGVGQAASARRRRRCGGAGRRRRRQHGHMTHPRQRGALAMDVDFRIPPVDASDPTDYCAHCLNAGDTGAGAGSNGGDWSPHDPLDGPSRAARAVDHGMCRDAAAALTAALHKAGGTLYGGGAVVANGTAGGTMDFEVTITTSRDGCMAW